MRNKFKLVSFLVLFVAFFVVTNEVKAACVGGTPNGSLELGEQCDDGNPSGDDYCSNACSFQCVADNGGNIPDGILELGEQCDDGNFISGDGCNSFCRNDVVAVCGNGVKEGGESCDDGNSVSGDGCENDCNWSPSACGNGIFEPWLEQCEYAFFNNEEICPLECSCSMNDLIPDGLGGCVEESGAVCGNGTKEGNEGCDDGNNQNGDGCSSICQDENDNDDDDDENDDDQQGDLRVKLKTYDCNGNEELKKIEGSKVKLYERDGDKVETDKTNSKGEANFRDIETGKYKVKCEVDGYVSMKDKSKTAYESGYEKIKDGERATETCRLVKKSCNGKLAKTGGSLFSYFFGLIF